VKSRAYAVLVVSFLVAQQDAWSAPYTITDIGNLGGSSIQVTGINLNGEVVGAGFTSGGVNHGFLYSAGVLRDLGTLGGTSSFAYGINDSGVVVGYVMTGSSSPRPITYTISGGFTDLGTVGGPATGVGMGINNSGSIVGTAPQAFRYSGGSTQILGTLGGTYSYARAINSSGQIAGYSDTATAGVSHAFSYTTGSGFTDLGTFGGTNSGAQSINDHGQIVGWANNAGGSQRAFSTTGTGPLKDLGTLGGLSSVAFDVNNGGQIVGFSSTGSATHAFLYDGTSMLDLNSLIGPGTGWTLTNAQAINDAGQIAGYGTIGGQTHVFLLSPVPEPATWVSLISGGAVGAFALFRRRKRKSVRRAR